MARIANDNPINEANKADDNIIQPFQLIESGLRGRLVRLGSVADEILAAHNYPEPVAHILAEAMGLGLILASMLKYDGIFTLQTSTDGPVKALVVDVTSEGVLRSYAGYDKDELEKALHKTENDTQDKNRYSGLDYTKLVGNGYLAFTVDQGDHTERYQGIVSIEGESLSQSVQHYFEQSEQIRTCVRVAAGRIDGKWRCGSLMIQKLPDAEPNPDEEKIINLNNDESDKSKSEQKEDWERSVILMQTCTEEEFLAPDLHSADLLVRLFHEEGIRVFDQKYIYKGCRCSRERVENVIRSLSQEEIDECLEDGNIEMTCEFCSQLYSFTKEDVISLRDSESE